MSYAKIKEAMTKAGHAVSEGTEWLTEDAIAFRNFCHFELGVASHIAHEVLQFPQVFEARLGAYLGLAPKAEAPVAAPTEAEDAGQAPEAQADTPVDPEPATEAPADEPAEEAPVEVVAEAPAEEAPAEVPAEEPAAPVANVFEATPQ